MSRSGSRRLLNAGLVLIVALGTGRASSAQPIAFERLSGSNTLTSSEQTAGWRLLFDGSTTSGWRGFRQPAVPAGWQVVDGALTRVAAGGDLITTDRFANFELDLEWQIAPGGTIILDDAARPGERWIARRWRREWPDFEFRLWKGGTKGTLIGRRRG